MPKTTLSPSQRPFYHSGSVVARLPSTTPTQNDHNHYSIDDPSITHYLSQLEIKLSNQGRRSKANKQIRNQIVFGKISIRIIEGT